MELGYPSPQSVLSRWESQYNAISFVGVTNETGLILDKWKFKVVEMCLCNKVSGICCGRNNNLRRENENS